MAASKKPTTIDVDSMPEETKRYLADATLKFFRRIMNDPVSRAKIEAEMEKQKKQKSPA